MPREEKVDEERGARRGVRSALAALGRSLFELTPSERGAVAIILGLALLGLAAKWWHVSARRDRNPPREAAQVHPAAGAADRKGGAHE